MLHNAPCVWGEGRSLSGIWWWWENYDKGKKASLSSSEEHSVRCCCVFFLSSSDTTLAHSVIVGYLLRPSNRSTSTFFPLFLFASSSRFCFLVLRLLRIAKKTIYDRFSIDMKIKNSQEPSLSCGRTVGPSPPTFQVSLNSQVFTVSACDRLENG